MNHFFAWMLILAATSAQGDSSIMQRAAPGYVSYFSGSERDVSPATSSGLLLVGGGLDREDAGHWLVERAGRGDVVVLRASGADGYNDWFMSLGANSVETFVFSGREAASDAYILRKLDSAEAIFIAGGDQSDYMRFWLDTPLSKAVMDAYQSGAVVGGTSAGLAVLGEYIYTAYYESATTAEVLKNPFHENVTLGRWMFKFGLLENVITDTHFRDRDRMGRLLVFMARLSKRGWSSFPRAIAVDEEAALGVSNSGQAQLFAAITDHAYMLEAGRIPSFCERARPLTFEKISVQRLGKGSSFDLTSWSGQNVLNYELSVRDGLISSSIDSIY